MTLPKKTLCWVQGPPWDRTCEPVADALEVRLVDAGQGWALVLGTDGHEHRLCPGDSLSVPAVMFS
jgi:beta-lactamase superfamily II metal-dependent hydrolase